MKLAEHVEHIRQLIDKAIRNRFGRMGISAGALTPQSSIPKEYIDERKRIETIREVFIAETGSVGDAYEKLVEEFTFTLFNRIAALKVMEAHTLHPEIITRRSQHSDRSFAHNLWLDNNPSGRNEEMEGLLGFINDQLSALGTDIPLFNPDHPYHLLPTAIELNSIISAVNSVENDEQVEDDIWKSDDVLGWLYESYNNYKKAAHKESGDKTEYNKVSIQSQVYTPRWVVKFLVDNSLGKLYLEMYPDSALKEKYKVANAPKKQTRKPKSLKEVKLIDVATGSGNFLLYAFDLFYDLYQDQIDNYAGNYNENKIPELILKNNLHGVDLDDRAIQLAQLGLYIKAKRRKRSAKIEHFNIVSSDFFLPEFQKVKHLFENGEPLRPELEKIVIDLWSDLQQAYKFGALIRLEEKFSKRLDALVEQFKKAQLQMFADETLANYEQFKDNFFSNLQKAVEHNTRKQGLTFLNTKTQDAITFLELLTQNYDIAVANPPYTDSGDFGIELKRFVDSNYKLPFKFNANLYAAFIKRCYELIKDNGKMALIHPLTFMYIKTFEDVRKFIIENTHILLFVDYGPDTANVFDGSFASAPAMYVLEKTEIKNDLSLFVSLNQYTRTINEKYKKEYCLQAIADFSIGKNNSHNYLISQQDLTIIRGAPFIYWLSNNLREKFKLPAIDTVCPPKSGLATSNNDRFLRYWWELDYNDISFKQGDKKGWKFYAKGGGHNKWFGNLWVCVNWKNNAAEMRSTGRAVFRNEEFYFREGITYSALGSGSFRLLPSNSVYDVGGASLFPLINSKLEYFIGLLNSNFTGYIINSLNPTVNTQVGDIERIPFVKPSEIYEDRVSKLSKQNIEIKKHLNTFRVYESNFAVSPLLHFASQTLKDRLLEYCNFENAQNVLILLSEAIINQTIFEVYQLDINDRHMVEIKMGRSVGELPITNEAKTDFIKSFPIDNKEILSFIEDLPITTFDREYLVSMRNAFLSLYQSNNNLEDFCLKHSVNPINVWYWFKRSNIIPDARASEIAMEFLINAIRTVLTKDKDGIIPLVGLPNEPRLLNRVEQYCLDNGFTSAQFTQLDSLLGRPIDEYIEQHLFKNLSDHLNLFMYLPKTPFIWHLSSGENQGFEAYISIYKWNRDSLFKIKTQYTSKRVENLEYRQIQLGGGNTAQALNEKEIIRLQLEEIKVFNQKIDELIAEGYDPKLDDGVGKNIAPLQKKGLLKAEVLNKKQLEKYLNADW